MSQPRSRTTQVSVRIPPETLALVKRAAELQGQSLSAFIVASAREAARQVVEAGEIVRLGIEDQRALADAILNPPPPNAALKKAAERYRTLIYR